MKNTKSASGKMSKTQRVISVIFILTSANIFYANALPQRTNGAEVNCVQIIFENLIKTPFKRH